MRNVYDFLTGLINHNTPCALTIQGSSGTGTSLRKSPQIDVFTELDPLGTGLSKPYIDKKDFFQHLKNPPKKVLKDLAITNSGDTFPTNFDISLESLDPIRVRSDSAQKSSDTFEDGDFANFEKFENGGDRPNRETASPQVHPPKRGSPQQSSSSSRSNHRTIHHQPLSVSLPPEDSPMHHKPANQNSNMPSTASSAMSSISDSHQSVTRIPSPKKYQSLKKKDYDMEAQSSRRRESIDKQFPVDFSMSNDPPSSPLRSCSSEANSRLSSSSAELDIVPEPPPRGAASILINPPPLPPKKQGVRGGSKPPPRPPHTDNYLHYDFIDREETSPTLTRRERNRTPEIDDTKPRFDDNFSPPSPRTLKRNINSAATSTMSSYRYDSTVPTTLSALFRNPYISNVSSESKKMPTTTSSSPNLLTKPSLDITLNQLTSSNLLEFATSLDMSVAELTSLTLQQLTECLARLSAKESKEVSTTSQHNIASPDSKPAPLSAKLVETSFVSSKPLFKADFDQGTKQQTRQSDEQPGYDKYAVFRELLELEQMREEASMTKDGDSVKSLAQEESSNDLKDTAYSADRNNETKSLIPPGVSNFQAAGELSVELPPLSNQFSKHESKIGTIREYAPANEKNDEFTTAARLSFQEDAEVVGRLQKRLEEKTKSYDTEKSETRSQERKTIMAREESEQVDEEAEDDEKDEDEEEEEDDEEEEEEEEEPTGVSDEGLTKKSTSETKASPFPSGMKDRYAALREIVDESEPKVLANSTRDEKPTSSPITSPIQKQTPKILADQDLLKLFSEPALERGVSPSKLNSQPETDLRSIATDIFEEIRMLNNTASHLTSCRLRKDSIRLTTTPATTTGYEDFFSPFTESSGKQEVKDTREMIGTIKDEGDWAKFESSAVFNSDKSSYEGPGSVGGTSPWSPDEKEFQMDGGSSGKTIPKQQQQPQHRLHSGESDNEWKDEEESEESNGRRQVRDDSGYWCGRHSRCDVSSEEAPYYEKSVDKDRHFRERGGSRKSRGSPWPKQPSSQNRARNPSPWHEEPGSRGWLSRDEGDPHGPMRGRYPPGRKLMPGSCKDEMEESTKGSYWKCRTKGRPWNGDREGFRNVGGPLGQQPMQQGPHFPGEPIYYEEDRLNRRMMLWTEDRDEERDRDRFSSQESMGYDDEERRPRRGWDRRLERWDEETGGKFWSRRAPGDVEPRGVPRLDPRGEYESSHEMYRKMAHYCRGDSREHRERSAGHELYPPGSTGGTGCWPEDEYSLPLSDRPDNAPRYITRKRHWPKRPNSANDEREMTDPAYADPRMKYGMSRSECSDNDSELYHRPYRSRSRESYWGSDQEFDSWTGGGGSGNERLYWSEGPDAKSETLHRRRINRHKPNRTTPQKSQNSPFEDDFTETPDRCEPSFDSFAPEADRVLIMDMETKGTTTPRNVKEHLRKDSRGNRYSKPPGDHGSGYFENEPPPGESPVERSRLSSDLKTTPEDFPSEVANVLATIGSNFVNDENVRDSFFNGNPSPGFDDDDAFASKSEMADRVPETTCGPVPHKNSRQNKYGNNKIKGDHDIRKSESVNIFVRESDPFDDDDFFK